MVGLVENKVNSARPAELELAASWGWAELGNIEVFNLLVLDLLLLVEIFYFDMSEDFLFYSIKSLEIHQGK